MNDSRDSYELPLASNIKTETSSSVVQEEVIDINDDSVRGVGG